MENPKKLATGHTTRRTTKQRHNTICIGHHYGQTYTNNICILLQRSGGNDVPNTVVCGNCNGRDNTEIRT